MVAVVHNLPMVLPYCIILESAIDTEMHSVQPAQPYVVLPLKAWFSSVPSLSGTALQVSLQQKIHIYFNPKWKVAMDL